jgi:hypothetical protein
MPLPVTMMPPALPEHGGDRRGATPWLFHTGNEERIMSLQTTKNDWVISGHGSTATASKPAETSVPAHVRLVLLAPPGAFLSNRLGQALERGTRIDRLVLRQNGRDNAHSPTVYEPGSKAPNLTLHFIGPHDIGTPTVPHVIGVSADTLLSDVWARIPASSQVVTVYWAACSNIDNDGHGPTVDY